MTTLLEKRRKDTVDKIAIMQAFVDGKEILCWAYDQGHAGASPIRYPSWNWSQYNYEVADEKA